MTLETVTKELSTANSKLDNLHKDNYDILEYLDLSQNTFKEGFLELLDFFKGSSLKELEDKREDGAYKQEVLDALQNLEPKETKNEKEKNKESGLTGILAGLAITIGTIAGIIKAQLQAIKLFTTAFRKAVSTFIKAITPKFIIKATKEFSDSIVKQLKTLKTTLLTTVANIGKAIRTTLASVFVSLSTQFNLLKTSIGNSKSKVVKGIVATFNSIRSTISAFFKPFRDVYIIMKRIVRTSSRAASLVSDIGSTLTKFTTLLGNTLKFVSRLFLPLTIAMTLWDTVKGMFEGFEKEGIVGGIKGAITGLFNSLIFGPLDMIKSAVSWVLGVFGFDKAEAILDSFSFEETFTSIINALFSPLQWLQDTVAAAIDWAKNKFKSVMSFFGLGRDEEVNTAKEEAGEAQRREKAFKDAGAIGKDAKGNIQAVDIIDTSSGKSRRELSEESLQAQGFTVLTPEERKVVEDQYEATRIEKIKAFEELNNAPKFSDLIPDFGDIINQLKESIFSFVTGAVDWVKKQFGFTGQGMPSFTELVLGLITLPYNLMKTVVGKIAGFFGFDKVADELEAFDFKDLVKRIMSSLTDMVSAAGDYVIGKFKSAGAAVADVVPDMDSIKNFLKGVLRNVLPVSDASSSWFSIKNLVAKAIPDSVYEFAGMDPKTGEITDPSVAEVIVGAPTAVKNEEVARAMQQTQNENTALQSQAASGGGSSTVNANSTVNNMNSSNTTVVRPQVMPTRQPNSPSEMIWMGPGDIGFR